MATSQLNVLVVEDSDTDAYALTRTLGLMADRSFHVSRRKTMADALAFLEEHRNGSEHTDLIFLDLGLPDTAGRDDTFRKIEKVAREIPVVVLTSVKEHNLALDIVGGGAEDYIVKGEMAENPAAMQRTIDFAIRRRGAVKGICDQVQEEARQKDQVISWLSGGYSAN